MNKHVLVMLHGLGQTRSAWQLQKELEDEFELITLDLLGHGNNIKDKPITLQNMADDIIEQLDDMGIHKFNLLGLSLGGIVAQEIVRRHKDRVKSLILTNTLSFFPYLPYSIIELYKPLKVTDPDKHLEIVLDNALHIKTPEVRERARSSFKINTDTYEQCAQSAFYVNYSALLYSLMIPVMVISSRYDRVTDKLFGFHSFRSLPPWNHKVRYVELPAGHLLPIEMPTQFNDEIRRFFNDFC